MLIIMNQTSHFGHLMKYVKHNLLPGRLRREWLRLNCDPLQALGNHSPPFFFSWMASVFQKRNLHPLYLVAVFVADPLFEKFAKGGSHPHYMRRKLDQDWNRYTVIIKFVSLKLSCAPFQDFEAISSLCPW